MKKKIELIYIPESYIRWIKLKKSQYISAYGNLQLLPLKNQEPDILWHEVNPIQTEQCFYARCQKLKWFL
jgi:hypothetical protein